MIYRYWCRRAFGPILKNWARAPPLPRRSSGRTSAIIPSQVTWQETGKMPSQFEFLILNAPDRLRQHGSALFGVRLDSGHPELASQAECVIVAAAGRKRTKELLRLARAQSRRVLLEVATAEEAAMAGDLGFDGVVSKTPLAAPVPLWGSGGIGLHSAAAWYAGGAAGLVLDIDDASWAPLAHRFRTLPAIVRGLRDAIREHVELAGKYPGLEPLAQADQDTRILDSLADTGVEALLSTGETRVAFSGIQDGRSAAMAAVLAAPLAKKLAETGARIGILAAADIAAEGARLVGELVVPFAGPRVETAPPLKPFDIAIVGMGCLLPKAPNVAAQRKNTPAPDGSLTRENSGETRRSTGRLPRERVPSRKEKFS